MSAPGHRWKFFRAGGVDQVLLRDGKDVLKLGELDQKLWVVLAMPTRGVHVDKKTLEHLDADKDGRIRAGEILAAIDWMKQALKDPEDLLRGGDSLPLASLSDGPVLVVAKRILESLGKKDATAITVADVADTEKIFAATRFNGDGIVPADSADDEPTRAAIGEIIALLGEVKDKSGKPGVNQEKADLFFKEVAVWVEWHKRAPSGVSDDAWQAFVAVRAKIDDWFTRCRLAALDGRAQAALSGSDADLAALALRTLGPDDAEVARLPLARVAVFAAGAAALPLDGPLNPAWSSRIAAFIDKTLGGKRPSLSEADWTALVGKLAEYGAWVAEKPVTLVETLRDSRLLALADGGRAKAAIDALIVQDLALADESAQIAAVEKTLLLRRDLFVVLNNFVNFSDFYRKKGAVFLAGRLFLDGRSCNLCVEVTDPPKHGVLASMAAAYLAYCDLSRPNGEKMTVVAAFTNGDADNLMVGRNGIFYGRDGRDWDATISKIVANPISVREAFWAPYKKLVRLIEEQVQKRASAAEADSHAKLAVAAKETAHVDKTKPVEDKKIDVGTVAAIGVAIGGIGAMVTGILAAFFGLGLWMPLGVIALFAMISGPSMMLAWLKLRQRNLGPILDANGWAINGRARINVPFGGALTDRAVLPKNAERSLDDPYAEKRRPWGVYIFLLAIVVVAALWYLGKLDRFLPERATSSSVLGPDAPINRAPPPVPPLPAVK